MISPSLRTIVLVGCLGGALALIAAAFPATGPAVIALGLVLLVITALDAVNAWRATRGLSATSPLLLRAVRGRDLKIAVTVANRNSTGAPARELELALQLPPEFQAESESLDCAAALAAGQQVTVVASIHPSRRGEFKVLSCVTRTASSLRLWSVQSWLPIDTTVRVYPDLVSDGTAAEFLQRGKAGSRVMRHAGKGREFEKLREYLAGDGWDEIDWKATARRGSPVVRVFQVERTQEIYVALDASRLSGRAIGSDGDATLERYVQAALVMALAAEAQGDRFGLITFSDRVHSFVRADKGKAHFRTCREVIYQLQPRAVEPDFAEFFAFLQTRLPRRALVIVLTSLDDPLAGETFSRYVGLASRRHLVVAGMPMPPGARPLFEAAAKDIDAIYDGLGGHLRWRQLAELRKVCQHKGVALHLLDPEKVIGQLAGIYLDVKRRQQL